MKLHSVLLPLPALATAVGGNMPFAVECSGTLVAADEEGQVGLENELSRAYVIDPRANTIKE